MTSMKLTLFFAKDIDFLFPPESKVRLVKKTPKGTASETTG